MYWFTNPALKSAMPMAGASAFKGLSYTFKMPILIMGANVLPEGRAPRGGVVDMINSRCSRRRAFFVTGEFTSSYAARVARALEAKGFAIEIWDKSKPEVPLETVKECAEAMSRFEPDVIIAVGGGSVIDGAKAAWILYERSDITDLRLMAPTAPLGLRKKAFLVAFPTTSGTGSECTAVAVVTDTEAQRKVPLASGELLPDIAVLTPDFVTGMSPYLTAGTGLDALAHAVDNVTSVATNDICDALALRATEMIFKYLPRAYRNGRDREARFRMHIAASMAGIAFGQGGVALTHALGHSLGKLFGVHHGVAVGLLIPYCLQFYAPLTDKYLDVCKALDIRAKTKERSLSLLVKRFKTLFKEVELPVDLKGLGISAESFDQQMDKLVAYSIDDPSTFSSPRPMAPEQCEQIFRYAYEGKDIDF
jgi:alcohol dehydrogenase class IV